MFGAMKRFLGGLFDSPVTIQGMSGEARVDTGLDEARAKPGPSAAEQEEREMLDILTKNPKATQGSAIRFLGKRSARRR